jgi:hypothetical protein
VGGFAFRTASRVEAILFDISQTAKQSDLGFWSRGRTSFDRTFFLSPLLYEVMILLRIHVVITVLFMLISKGKALEVIPSLAPLQYVTPQVIGQYIIESAESAVWSSLLPIDQQDALAIFISEGVSGFLGGVALKGKAQ